MPFGISFPLSLTTHALYQFSAFLAHVVKHLRLLLWHLYDFSDLLLSFSLSLFLHLFPSVRLLCSLFDPLYLTPGKHMLTDDMQQELFETRFSQNFG